MMTLFQLRKKMELDQGHVITSAAIAHLAGISVGQYCRYESGKNVPNVLIAANLAKALNLSMSDMVEIIRATVEHDASVAALPPMEHMIAFL